MSNAPDDDTIARLPPIPELTVTHANRLMCADYLRQIARMIEQGTVTAFELEWMQSVRKPVGRLATNAEFLIGPVESHLLTQVAEIEARKAKKIDVTDVIDKLKDHPECPDGQKDNCAVCNTKLS